MIAVFSMTMYIVEYLRALGITGPSNIELSVVSIRVSEPSDPQRYYTQPLTFVPALYKLE